MYTLCSSTSCCIHRLAQLHPITVLSTYFHIFISYIIVLYFLFAYKAKESLIFIDQMINDYFLKNLYSFTKKSKKIIHNVFNKKTHFYPWFLKHLVTHDVKVIPIVLLLSFVLFFQPWTIISISIYLSLFPITFSYNNYMSNF
jgi:hypothetical protein